MVQEMTTELLLNDRCSFEDLERLKNLSNQSQEALEQALENFASALDYYTASEILDRYNEDPLHLGFMSLEDPTDYVFDNLTDEDIVRFGLKNYDIDEARIENALNRGRDSPTAAFMDFQVTAGYFEEQEGYESEPMGEMYYSEE